MFPYHGINERFEKKERRKRRGSRGKSADENGKEAIKGVLSP